MEEITLKDVQNLFHQPLSQIFFRASQVHRDHFATCEIQASSLMSIKTGGCPENCAYCPQSAHYQTGIQKTGILKFSTVLESARNAKSLGATRFCMGAAWRSVRDGEEFDQILDLVKAVRAEGLEVCCTLGMLTAPQAIQLKRAGLY